jgi:phosphoglycolate phosphatase
MVSARKPDTLTGAMRVRNFLKNGVFCRALLKAKHGDYFMDIRGIIFDLDGTLLDTLEDLADAANATLAHFGFPGHTTDAYRYFVGEGLMTLIERIVPEQRRSQQEIADCMQYFLHLYEQKWDVKSRPYTGITEMLQQLRQSGLQLGVLSNKPHAFTRLCVKRFFPEDTFDFVYGQREGVPKKPDPSGAREIAALMNLMPRQILYVGDTDTDMQTGNQAGMFTLGVLWGFRERQELEASKASRIISHPAEVVSHVNHNR